ncbi:hypothetical protein F5888DRAFT_535693 [Russula emetica]|nr:hypothetical protein F5888DRAFT_535693 [Russula emetica]
MIGNLLQIVPSLHLPARSLASQTHFLPLVASPKMQQKSSGSHGHYRDFDAMVTGNEYRKRRVECSICGLTIVPVILKLFPRFQNSLSYLSLRHPPAAGN